MPLSLVFAFWSVSVLFIIIPGVDWAYSISAGLQQRKIFPAVIGLLSGHLVATIIVAAGVGALIAKVPAIMTTLTVIGALYLLWLGYGVFKNPSVPAANNEIKKQSNWQWILKGFCVSGLNPKVFLLFLALLPQFTDPNAVWPISIQILMLGLLHIVMCGIIYLMVGYGAKILLQARPRAAKLVSQISGLLMILIAILLLVEEVLSGH